LGKEIFCILIYGLALAFIEANTFITMEEVLAFMYLFYYRYNGLLVFGKII